MASTGASNTQKRPKRSQPSKSKKHFCAVAFMEGTQETKARIPINWLNEGDKVVYWPPIDAKHPISSFISRKAVVEKGVWREYHWKKTLLPKGTRKEVEMFLQNYKDSTATDDSEESESDGDSPPPTPKNPLLRPDNDIQMPNLQFAGVRRSPRISKALFTDLSDLSQNILPPSNFHYNTQSVEAFNERQSNSQQSPAGPYNEPFVLESQQVVSPTQITPAASILRRANLTLVSPVAGSGTQPTPLGPTQPTLLQSRKGAPADFKEMSPRVFQYHVMMELAYARQERDALRGQLQMLGQRIEPEESAFHLVSIKTEAEFWENEAKLVANPEFRALTARRIKSIGAIQDLRSTMKTILFLLFDKTILNKFSRDGMPRKGIAKIKLGDKQIYHVLRDVLMASTFGFTAINIHHELSEILRRKI